MKISTIQAILFFGTLTLTACTNSAPSLQVSEIDFAPAAAGDAAIAAYDRDGDGLLSAEERKSCPGIEANLAMYDGDSDGQVSADEIANRIQRWSKLGGSYLPLTCVVLLDGRPLSGARVELTPESFLNDKIEAASGTTGIEGTAAISVSPELIPEKLRGMPVARPGLYKAMITHPLRRIPERYNTMTEIGCEVSPDTANPAKFVEFALKSR